MSNFRERKKKRTERYFKEEYKKKWVVCTACNGSGYYDHCINGKTPKCGACNGTGKERES